jgi:hypothetical protein
MKRRTAPNTACTPAAYAGAEPARTPAKYARAMVVVVGPPALMRWGGRRSQWTAPSPDRRVFKQFLWLNAGSVKAALSRPAWLSTGEAVLRHTSG